MRRFGSILAFCFVLTLAVFLIYRGAPDSKSSFDGTSGRISPASSITYGMIESIIPAGSIKMAELQADDDVDKGDEDKKKDEDEDLFKADDDAYWKDSKWDPPST